MSFDHRACSVGGAGDGAHRQLCHMVRALDQARAQARVAQWGRAELARRPGLGVEPLAGRQRREARGGQCEALAPGRLELIHIHRLARLGGGMGAVVASAPGTLTDPDPVRRAQACPRVLGLVDKGLQQPGPVAVEALEVLAHRARHPAQHVGGQVAAGHGGGESRTGTAPPPGAGGCVGTPRPIPPRCREPSAAAPRRRTPPHPANPVRSPPDSASDGRQRDPRRAGAHGPSRCSKPSVARRCRPAPASARAAPRPLRAHRALAPPRARAPVPCAPRRGGLVARRAKYDRRCGARPAPWSSLRVATARARRADGMHHRRDRRPAPGS